MIKIKIDKSIQLSLIVNILNIYMGNSVLISKEYNEDFDFEKPMSKTNNAIVYYENINADGKKNKEYLLVNDDGVRLLVLKDVAYNEHFLIIKEIDFEFLQGFPVKEIEFVNTNSFSAANAENLVSLLGGQLIINNELVYEKNLKNALFKSGGNRDSNKDYYDENNKLKSLLKNDIQSFFKDSLGKYAYLNNDDESLEVVSSIYKSLINSNINKIVIEERLPTGRAYVR